MNRKRLMMLQPHRPRFHLTVSEQPVAWKVEVKLRTSQISNRWRNGSYCFLGERASRPSVHVQTTLENIRLKLMCLWPDLRLWDDCTYLQVTLEMLFREPAHVLRSAQEVVRCHVSACSRELLELKVLQVLSCRLHFEKLWAQGCS